ncbi:cyclopropane-fatty-acyl-phospholipid synthase family protein [Glycomyces sp. A-F 0318]|uniref:SAM-dependent methyltransferase n=1 Tax=Glycomyces amatae TaxID=2881355 RepID=UPI001E3CF3B8|nr:cyclopropane-fatty-acyl-phospholipid synthase family protein [Glycomyces amatae]MCD0447481.1 cyclopropane-fatty-acyl-phospholipid synthase family protein [Glycomyces amatae]
MTLAADLYDLAAKATGTAPPIRLRAWDGTEAGPDDGGPVLRLDSPDALRRLLWSPGELGLSQAYILGEVDVEGDLADGLRRVHRAAAGARPSTGLSAAAAALPFALRHRLIGPRPKAAGPEHAVSGRLHSEGRDRQVISFHYDLSNEFYELILDPDMLYSCGYWTSGADSYTLADSQRDKLDLVCRKLGLAPGARLLDVGCGWGALAMHAAEHYGAEVVAVTLSAQQYRFALARAAERDLLKKIDFRLADYREIDAGGFDAVSAIEMGEHVGRDGYGPFASRLRGLLGPGGRLLVQQMSRGRAAPGGGPFIETYIAPDMHMRPLGETVGLIEDAGFEVRDVEAMREHYVRTIRAWHDTLEARWDAAVDLVGLPTARVWRLYLVGAALAFEERRMGVDQILAVVPDGFGDAGMPATRRGFLAEAPE